MRSAELLLYTPDSTVKSKGAPPVSNFRVIMKDYAAWQSKVSSLVFFCALLGTAAVFSVICTLHAAGYIYNPESGFLVTGFTALPPLLEVHSVVAASEEPPSEPVLSANIPENTTLVDDDELEYKDTAEEPSSSSSDLVLLSHPVDLKPLSDVYHDMSEAELLWRASVGSRRRPRPVSVTPKVAFLFLTRGPLPLRPLWERYFKGHSDLYNIYIHAHPNYMPQFRSDSAFYRRNIPSKEVFWGKLSVFAAERRLLANALLDPVNERFVLLSESCIPITPLPVAYKYFTESKHSFVNAYFEPGRGGMGRYFRIKSRRKLNPEVSPAQWRKGSQWFEMSRELALMVVSDRKYYSKLEEFLCMNDCICYMDEHYLPTVLTILAPSKLANRTSHFIDFARSTAHPYQWEREAINQATLKAITTGHNCTYNRKLTSTCHMFARKFSPETLQPLLELAATSFGIP